MIIIEYERFSEYHHSKLWFYGRLAAVEDDVIITHLTGIGAVCIAFKKNQWNQTIEKNYTNVLKIGKPSDHSIALLQNELLHVLSLSAFLFIMMILSPKTTICVA